MAATITYFPPDLEKKVVVFGMLIIDGRQLFAVFDKFNAKSFVKFLTLARKKFDKVCLIIDRAVQHRKSKNVHKYLAKYGDDVKIIFFPTSPPFLNMVEECWHQAKNDLVVSRYYETFEEMQRAISEYFRTNRFHLSVVKFVMRKKMSDCIYI